MFKLKIVAALTASCMALEAGGLDIELDCSALSFPSFNLPSVSFGSCSLDVVGSQPDVCEKSLLSTSLELSKVYGTSLSFGCSGPSSLQGKKVNKRLANSKDKGIAFYTRKSFSLDPNTGFYFAGGKSSLETHEEIAKGAGRASAFTERLKILKYNMGNSANEVDCKKDTVLASMQCAFLSSTKGNNSSLKKAQNKNESSSNDYYHLTEMSTTPKEGLMLPSEKIELPLHKKALFGSTSREHYNMQAITKGRIGSITEHRAAMSQIIRENASSSSIPSYDSIQYDEITNRKDKELP